jgi:sulfur-oxidizing protein SoxY
MSTNRRAFLTATASLFAVTLLPRPFAWATLDDEVAAAIRAVVGDRDVLDGGIALNLPAVAQNGASVPITVFVESPMTPEDHVRGIHVFATQNPSPGVADFMLTPASGRAEVSTRIRLADHQEVIVLAELSDGRIFRTSAEVEVTVGGCAT